MYRHIAEAGGVFERDLLRAEMEAEQFQDDHNQIIKDALYA